MHGRKGRTSQQGPISSTDILKRAQSYLSTTPNFAAHVDTITEFLVANFSDLQRIGTTKIKPIIDKYLKSPLYHKNKQAFLENQQSDSLASDDIGLDDEQDGHGLVEYPDTNSLNSVLRANYQKAAPSNSAASESNSTPQINQTRSRVSNGSNQKKRGREDTANEASEDMPGNLRKKSRPTARYADLGGIESILQDVRELIERPLTHPEIYEWLGTQVPRGILLHGPPGCGKTQLANAIAGELGISFFPISAPEIVSGMSGESEQKIRSLFQDAKARAPSIIFIDEIDAITPKRENAAREMERRIVAQLLTCMDSLEGGTPVMVIGATNRPDALDQALRRSGRFDREICLNVPDQAARVRILKVIASKLRLSGDFNFELIASLTPGYVGADLQSIAKEAASIAVNRIFSVIESQERLGDVDEKSISMTGMVATDSITPTGDLKKNDVIARTNEGMEIDETGNPQGSTGINTSIQNMAPISSVTTESSHAHHHHSINASNTTVLHYHTIESRHHVNNFLRSQVEPFTEAQLAPLSITMDDFYIAIKRVQPSAKREGFATVPNVTWEDIGALDEIRKEMEMALLEPVRNKSFFDALNIPVSMGVLLYGPPGCGKTLLAKAIANQAQANFISVKGPELLNKFVGESERAVRVVFERAKASSPCIIFFDEIDALVPKRSGGENAVTERVVNQLLIELDGLEQRYGISVVAATNRPDILDPAMLRPGRLDKLLYVPLPSPEERIRILKTCARKTPLADDVDLAQIALDSTCTRYSGADIASLVREAAMNALEMALGAGQPGQVPLVTNANFRHAIMKVKPSVSKADQIRYEKLRDRLSSPHLIENKDEVTEAKENPNLSLPTPSSSKTKM